MSGIWQYQNLDGSILYDLQIGKKYVLSAEITLLFTDVFTSSSLRAEESNQANPNMHNYKALLVI